MLRARTLSLLPLDRLLVEPPRERTALLREPDLLEELADLLRIALERFEDEELLERDLMRADCEERELPVEELRDRGLITLLEEPELLPAWDLLTALRDRLDWGVELDPLVTRLRDRELLTFG